MTATADQREFTFAMNHGASIHHSSTDTGKGLPQQVQQPGGGEYEPVEADIATLMEACWNHTPSERPTMASVIDFLQMKIEQLPQAL